MLHLLLDDPSFRMVLPIEAVKSSLAVSRRAGVASMVLPGNINHYFGEIGFARSIELATSTSCDVVTEPFPTTRISVSSSSTIT